MLAAPQLQRLSPRFRGADPTPRDGSGVEDLVFTPGFRPVTLALDTVRGKVEAVPCSAVPDQARAERNAEPGLPCQEICDEHDRWVRAATRALAGSLAA